MITSISRSPLLFEGYKHGLLLHNSLCRQVPFFWHQVVPCLVLKWRYCMISTAKITESPHGATPWRVIHSLSRWWEWDFKSHSHFNFASLCFHSVTKVLAQFLTAACQAYFDWYRDLVLCVRPNYLKCFTAHPKVSDHINQRWGLGTCILMYIKSPIDILVQYLHESAAFWGLHMEKHLKASWRA